MDWSKVRKINARRSAEKAKRERHSAQEAERIATAGGAITVEELRTATQRTVPGAQGSSCTRWVWTFRGRDWVCGWRGGIENCVWSMCPFKDWQQNPDMREAIPLTTGARKWLEAAYPSNEIVL